MFFFQLCHNGINIRHRAKHKFVPNIYTSRIIYDVCAIVRAKSLNSRCSAVIVRSAQHYSLICNAICITNVVASFYLLRKWVAEKRDTYGNCARSDKSTQRIQNKEFELYLTFLAHKATLAILYPQFIAFAFLSASPHFRMAAWLIENHFNLPHISWAIPMHFHFSFALGT